MLVCILLALSLAFAFDIGLGVKSIADGDVRNGAFFFGCAALLLPFTILTAVATAIR